MQTQRKWLVNCLWNCRLRFWFSSWECSFQPRTCLHYYFWVQKTNWRDFCITRIDDKPTSTTTTTTIFQLSLVCFACNLYSHCVMYSFCIFSLRDFNSKMENCFSYYQKCKKSHFNFYQFFKILLANYDDSGKWVLNEAQKRHSFYCPSCKMITFLDIEEVENEWAIVFLKRRQFVIKLRKQIKEKRMRWEEQRKNSKCKCRLFEQ